MLRLFLTHYYPILPFLAAVLITALFYYHAAYRHPAYAFVPLGVVALGLLLQPLTDLLLIWLQATGSLSRGLTPPIGGPTMEWLGYLQAVDGRQGDIRLWYTFLAYPVLLGLIGAPFAHRVLRQVRIETLFFLVSLAVLTHPLLYQLIITPTLLMPAAPVQLRGLP